MNFDDNPADHTEGCPPEITKKKRKRKREIYKGIYNIKLHTIPCIYSPARCDCYIPLEVVTKTMVDDIADFYYIIRRFTISV